MLYKAKVCCASNRIGGQFLNHFDGLRKKLVVQSLSLTISTNPLELLTMSLYQDPMQTQLGMVDVHQHPLDIIPKRFSLFDPSMLRTCLCLIILIRNCFHVYLCWRQLRLCSRSTAPPSIMQGIMSQATFDSSKHKEMHEVELNFFRYIIDAIFSCLELYFGIFPYLWKLTMGWYYDVGDVVWHNIVFMVLLSTYMVLRTMPSVLYDKLILDHFYRADSEKVPPLVGLICTLAFLIVLIQVALIPIIVIFLFIEENGGWFFVGWIWGFLFVVSVLVLLFLNTNGTPCLGKSTHIQEGPLFNAIERVLRDFNFPTDRIYVLETFHFTNPTGYVWGYLCTRRLVILNNLIYNYGKPVEELYEDEVGMGLVENQVAAYVAHLLAHWYKNHSIKTFIMIQISLLIYLMLFGTCYQLPTLYEAAGFTHDFYPRIVGYWLVYKYVMPPYLTITNWIIFYFIRHFEYAADIHAWRMGYGRSLKSALLKLFSDSCTFPLVDHWYLMWNRKRPSIFQRIKNLQGLETGTRVSKVELI